MAVVLRSNTAITFTVTPGSGGFPGTAAFVSLAVVIGGVEVWTGPDKIDWATAIAAPVTFPAQASVISGASAFAEFVFRFYDENEVEIGHTYSEVIIESGDLLRVLDNSFATWAEISLVERTMVNIKSYGFSDDDSKKAALINAYHNIGDVHVDFWPKHRRGRYYEQNRFWDTEGLFENDLQRIYSTRQLNEETWLKLKADQRERLIRAQLIEANFLLSGFTPEKQRLAGLLSHSAGESAHFYRTTKPLELPVCRETALALKGIISYVVRIGG